jgi:hypothetical protein
MKFGFLIPSNTAIHVYVSMLDPRNSSINGFLYNGNSGVTRIRV